MNTPVDKGFLSEDMPGWIEKIRKDEAAWFGLAEDTNVFFEKLIEMINVPTAANGPPSPELVQFLLCVRTASSLQGVLLLAERGMVIEARTLARSCLENFLYVRRVATGGVEFVKSFMGENIRQGIQRAKNLIKPGIREYLDPEVLAAYEQEIKKFKENVGKIPTLKISDIAADAGLNELYIFYQRLSSDSAHPSITSLYRYMRLSKSASHEETFYVSAQPDFALDDIADTFETAIMAVHGCALTLLESRQDTDSLHAEFSALVDKFTQLSDRQALKA